MQLIFALRTDVCTYLAPNYELYAVKVYTIFIYFVSVLMIITLLLLGTSIPEYTSISSLGKVNSDTESRPK